MATNEAVIGALSRVTLGCHWPADGTGRTFCKSSNRSARWPTTSESASFEQVTNGLYALRALLLSYNTIVAVSVSRTNTNRLRPGNEVWVTTQRHYSTTDRLLGEVRREFLGHGILRNTAAVGEDYNGGFPNRHWAATKANDDLQLAAKTARNIIVPRAHAETRVSFTNVLATFTDAHSAMEEKELPADPSVLGYDYMEVLRPAMAAAAAARTLQRLHLADELDAGAVADIARKSPPILRLAALFKEN